MTKEKKLQKFISKIEKDFPHEITYFLNDQDYLDLVNQEENLIDLLENTDFFKVDIIGSSIANEYLKTIEFTEIISCISELGYEIKDIENNVELVASIVAIQKLRSDFQETNKKITEYIDELNE